MSELTFIPMRGSDAHAPEPLMAELVQRLELARQHRSRRPCDVVERSAKVVNNWLSARDLAVCLSRTHAPRMRTLGFFDLWAWLASQHWWPEFVAKLAESPGSESVLAGRLVSRQILSSGGGLNREQRAQLRTMRAAESDMFRVGGLLSTARQNRTSGCDIQAVWDDLARLRGARISIAKLLGRSSWADLQLSTTLDHDAKLPALLDHLVTSQMDRVVDASKVDPGAQAMGGDLAYGDPRDVPPEWSTTLRRAMSTLRLNCGLDLDPEVAGDTQGGYVVRLDEKGRAGGTVLIDVSQRVGSSTSFLCRDFTTAGRSLIRVSLAAHEGEAAGARMRRTLHELGHAVDLWHNTSESQHILSAPETAPLTSEVVPALVESAAPSRRAAHWAVSPQKAKDQAILARFSWRLFDSPQARSGVELAKMWDETWTASTDALAPKPIVHYLSHVIRRGPFLAAYSVANQIAAHDGNRSLSQVIRRNWDGTGPSYSSPNLSAVELGLALATSGKAPYDH